MRAAQIASDQLVLTRDDGWQPHDDWWWTFLRLHYVPDFGGKVYCAHSRDEAVRVAELQMKENPNLHFVTVHPLAAGWVVSFLSHKVKCPGCTMPAMHGE